jgi:exopolysaccharide production protein ExoZ
MYDPTGVQTQPTTLFSLQYLRGVAALMVVWHHAQGQLPEVGKFIPFDFGSAGVDIFFVISGFIMVVTTSGKEAGAWPFFRRRLIRVVPLYWLLTLLMVGAWSVYPSLFRSLTVSLETLVMSLLFIPHFSLSHPEHTWPLLVPGWTLNFEMYFYALFACCLWLPERVRYTALILFLFGSVSVGLAYGPFESALARTYTSWSLLEFAGGMLLATTLKNRIGVAWPAWISAGFLAAGVTLLVADTYEAIGALQRPVGAVACVLGTLSAGYLAKQWNPGILAGDASYSVYLSRLFTLGVLRSVWRLAFPTENSWILAWCYMGLSLLCCLIVGILCHRYLEKPIDRWLRSHW